LKKIYLALPFSGIEELSFKVANEVASLLIATGNYYVFSPISHSYPIWKTEMVSHTYEVWLGQDKAFMDWCDEIICIIIEYEGINGRELINKSRGVQTEFKWANEQNKPIIYCYYNSNTKNLTYAETN
jgi:hypothetical protein